MIPHYENSNRDEVLEFFHVGELKLLGKLARILLTHHEALKILIHYCQVKMLDDEHAWNRKALELEQMLEAIKNLETL